MSKNNPTVDCIVENIREMLIKSKKYEVSFDQQDLTTEIKITILSSKDDEPPPPHYLSWEWEFEC